MGHLIFYIIVVVLYIVLRCGRSDTSTQIFFGVKWSDWEKKRKERKRKKPSDNGKNKNSPSPCRCPKLLFS